MPFEKTKFLNENEKLIMKMIDRVYRCNVRGDFLGVDGGYDDKKKLHINISGGPNNIWRRGQGYKVYNLDSARASADTLNVGAAADVVFRTIPEGTTEGWHFTNIVPKSYMLFITGSGSFDSNFYFADTEILAQFFGGTYFTANSGSCIAFNIVSTGYDVSGIRVQALQ